MFLKLSLQMKLRERLLKKPKDNIGQVEHIKENILIMEKNKIHYIIDMNIKYQNKIDWTILIFRTKNSKRVKRGKNL